MIAGIGFCFMSAILFFVSLLLLACFNTMREMRKETKIYAKTAYHNARMNELILRLSSRYERNLSLWYNDATGRTWELSNADNNVYESIKKEIQSIKSTLEDEYRRRL
jgi:hypothetical protein